MLWYTLMPLRNPPPTQLSTKIINPKSDCPCNLFYTARKKGNLHDSLSDSEQAFSMLIKYFRQDTTRRSSKLQDIEALQLRAGNKYTYHQDDQIKEGGIGRVCSMHGSD